MVFRIGLTLHPMKFLVLVFCSERSVFAIDRFTERLRMAKEGHAETINYEDVVSMTL
jgi:hypothetical protein